MSPGVIDIEAFSQKLKLEAEARLAANEQEAAKHPSFTFYFCGKIRKHCWRHGLLNLRDVSYPLNQYRSGDAPQVRHGLGAGLHYGGPFFVACDHGCNHSPSSHGAMLPPEAAYDCGMFDCDDTPPYERIGPPHFGPKEVVANCRISIAQADIVFAWLDDLTAYGSFSELGFAHALGKPIWIAWPKPLPDLWFIQEMARATVVADTAALAFRELLFTQLNRSFL